MASETPPITPSEADNRILLTAMKHTAGVPDVNFDAMAAELGLKDGNIAKVRLRQVRLKLGLLNPNSTPLRATPASKTPKSKGTGAGAGTGAKRGRNKTVTKTENIGDEDEDATTLDSPTPAAKKARKPLPSSSPPNKKANNGGNSIIMTATDDDFIIPGGIKNESLDDDNNNNNEQQSVYTTGQLFPLGQPLQQQQQQHLRGGSGGGSNSSLHREFMLSTGSSTPLSSTAAPTPDHTQLWGLDDATIQAVGGYDALAGLGPGFGGGDVAGDAHGGGVEDFGF